MRYLYYIFIIGLLASCGVMISQEDGEQMEWSIFRGSPSLCGYTPCSLPAEPTLSWSISRQTRTVAAPIVHDSVVYTLSRKGDMIGYSLDGDSCLSYSLGNPVEASFIIDKDRIFIGRIDGMVTALAINRNTMTGRKELSELWNFETEGQISGSPNIIDDHLLIGSYDNFMYTLDAATGAKISQFETGYYINGAAAVSNKNLVFGGCDSWLRIINSDTGTACDSLLLDSYVPASPAIWDDAITISDYQGNVYDIRIDTQGKILSHTKLHEASGDKSEEGEGSVAMPTVTADAVYLLTGDRYLTRINRKDASVVWQKMLRGTTGECAPLVAQDKVLVCTKDGHVSIFDAKDGTELWHYEVGEQIIASPAIIDRRFYILTSRGTLLCFS